MVQAVFQSMGSSLAWSVIASKPFTVVSTDGNGDFGPATSTTGTDGIQDALNSIPNGGIVYVRRGTYNLTSFMSNTGNYQVVIFEAGTVLNVTGYTPGYYNTSQNVFIFNVGCLATTNSSQSPTPYVYNYWFGNGTTVNGNNLIYQSGAVVVWITVGTESVSPNSMFIEFAGFYFINGIGQFLSTQGGGTTSLAADSYGVQYMYLHDLWFNGVGSNFAYGRTSLSTFIVQKAAYIKVERCILDATGIPSSVDYSNPYVHSNTAEQCHDIEFIDCEFINNGSNGQSEFQGTNSPSTTVDRYTYNIRLKHCKFKLSRTATNGTAANYGGAGGIYIDDNNGNGGTGWIKNIFFEDCEYYEVGISFQTQSSVFGYVRFSGQMPLLSGSLGGRSPGQTTAITVGASPFTYTNNDGFDETIIIEGGTVTAIEYDGISTSLSQSVFTLGVGHSVTVTYTTAPSMYKSPR